MHPLVSQGSPPCDRSKTRNVLVHSAVALGEVRDLSDEVGLDEPFTAFHSGSETGVSHDEVKFVRLVAFDSIGREPYSQRNLKM